MERGATGKWIRARQKWWAPLLQNGGAGGPGGCMRKEHQEKGMWQREIYGKSKIAERREGWQGWIFNEGSGVCSLIMQPAGGNKRCVGFPCVSVSTPLIHHSHSCLLDLSAAPCTWLRPQQLSSTPSLTTAVSEGRINSGGRGGRSRLINFVVYFVVGDSVWYQLDVRKYISAWQPKTQCVLVWPFLTQKNGVSFSPGVALWPNRSILRPTLSQLHHFCCCLN